MSSSDPPLSQHEAASCQLMWSSVLQALHPARGVKASDTILGSWNRYGSGTSECYCMRKTGGNDALNVSEKK